MAGWTIYHDHWINPTYVFWGISPLGPQQPFMTPWTRWTKTFGLDSKYTTHRSRRCCCPFWPLESAAPSAQQSSSECWPPDMLQTPANPRVARCSMYICLRCAWHILIFIYIYIYIWTYMIIYDEYIYIIYEYRLGYKVDVFIIRTTKGKIRKLTTKYWYFRVLEFEMHIIIPWSEDDWYTIMWYNMTQVYREKVYSMYMFISL